MPQTVTAAQIAAGQATITKPGFFVQLDLASQIRACSRDDTTWNGNVWPAANVNVSDVGTQPDGSQRCTVTMGNTDLSLGAIALGDAQLQGRRAQVWSFLKPAGSLAAADPVQIFDGVVDSAVVDTAAVTFSLVTLLVSATYLPRRRITPASGFNRLLPAGRVIQIGSQRFRLERS
jgi:hypothetical protein